ncbi:MAG: hypothetical protein JW706_07825 [Opitutales bacterium]|nr:hypothetical protein [Opitutales bacterium]
MTSNLSDHSLEKRMHLLKQTPIRWRSTLSLVALLRIVFAALLTFPVLAADGPTRQELDGGTHRIVKFEQKVERMRGQPMRLGFEEKDALQRIESLRQRYPDHPEVMALVERAKKASFASMGHTAELSPGVAAYRLNEQKLKEIFATRAAEKWEALQARIASTPSPIVTAFPAPSVDDVSSAEVAGRYVILNDFHYPANEFTDFGNQYVAVGTGARGYYFVRLSHRNWFGAYEAFKRYRRLINRDIPENQAWTVVGKISSVALLVPDAGKTKIRAAVWGWEVVPEAIYIPGCTLAQADPDIENGGTFAAEEVMEEIKGDMYTVKAIPPDVSPERLVEIFAIAIQEKNYPLYLDCIDPARLKTRTARQLAQYHWDLHQERFAGLYVAIRPDPPRIHTLRGVDLSENSDDPRITFLSSSQKEVLRLRSGPLVKEAELTTRAFDERGQQYGSPKPRYLRRIDSGQWYIDNFEQPF